MTRKNGWIVLPTIYIIACLVAIGCSTGSPVSPTIQTTPEMSGTLQSGNHPVLWGLWEVHLDPATATVEITPIRGAQFTVDVVSFLQPPAGSLQNLGIEVTDVSDWMTEGLLTVDVRLTHPFPGMDQYTGHDVKGVFIAPGNMTASSDGSLIFTDGIDQPILLNADGYTRWQNPVEFPDDGTIFTYTPGALGTPGDFTSTINGYKYFADGIEADDDVATFFSDPGNVANRGQFRAGSAIHRTYELKFPIVDDAPELVFQYAVIAHWVEPTELDPYDLPGSFPPEANATEAIHLSVTDNSDLWYYDGSSGGSMKFDLEIYNWAPYLVSGVVTDYVHSIVIDCPDGTVQPADFAVFQADFPPATPGCDNSSVVEIELVELELVSSEPITVLFSVVADDGDGYEIDLDPGNGTLYSSSPLAAYFFTTVNVGEMPLSPTVTSITPDHANQHELVEDAVITGTNFIDVTSVRLEKDIDVIESSTFIVDSGTQITADFDLTGFPFGLYDVVVEVVGGYTGTLVDGFEIYLQCGTTAHALDDVYTADHFVSPHYVATVLTAGPYEGYTIFSEVNVVYGGYVVFDHMTQADSTPFIHWGSLAARGNSLVLEAANENGLMIISATYHWFYWDVVNQTTGSVVQSFFTGHMYPIVGDFDGVDDFWGIVMDRPDPGVLNVYDYYLQHWQYDPGNPSAPYSFAEEWNVNDLFRDTIDDTHKWETFGDIVMHPSAEYCFVLTGFSSSDDYHKVDKVDLTGGTPTIVASYDFTGEGLNNDGQVSIGQSRSVNMDLDFSDDDLTQCRLFVAGSKRVDFQWYMNNYRFDTDLNLLGTSSEPYDIVSGYGQKFWGMAFDMENHVICHLTEWPYGGSETHYGVSPMPPDW